MSLNMCYFDITRYWGKELFQTQDPPVWPCKLLNRYIEGLRSVFCNSLSKVCVARREAQSNDDFLPCRMSPPCPKVTINLTDMTASHRNAFFFFSFSSSFFFFFFFFSFFFLLLGLRPSDLLRFHFLHLRGLSCFFLQMEIHGRVRA